MIEATVSEGDAMAMRLPGGFQAAARRRRSLAVGLSFVALLILTYVSLYTVRGQNLDNLSMEALRAGTEWLPSVLSGLQSLVSVPALVVMSLVVAGIAAFRRRGALAARALIVVGAANVVSQFLKGVLGRPELGVGISLPNSYPSGHVTYAAAIAFALVMVAPHRLRSTFAAFGWAWTTLMSLMVISMGWHRLADVLAALLIVTFWGCLAAPAEAGRAGTSTRSNVVQGLAWGALLCGVGLFAAAAATYSSRVGTPLTLAELYALTAHGTRAGTVMAAATFLLPAGLAGVIFNGVDRLGGGQ